MGRDGPTRDPTETVRGRPSSTEGPAAVAPPGPALTATARALRAGAGTQGFLARAKELDAWHATRLRPAHGLVLRLSLLRRALSRFGGRITRTPAAPVPRPPAGEVELTFVGHASVMLTTASQRVLTDPWLTDRLFGLRRFAAPSLAPVDAADVSLVLISHAHPDHLHLPSLDRLPRTATVVVPPGCGGLLRGLGFPRVAELGPGKVYAQDDLQVCAVPVRHSGRRGIGRRAACGFVLRAHAKTIYFAGDTGYFSGFAEIGRRFSPDVALLPIGGYEPIALRREHMSPVDALVAFHDLGARCLVPIAWGALPLAYELPEEPILWLQEEAERWGVARQLLVLPPGSTRRVGLP